MNWLARRTWIWFWEPPDWEAFKRRNKLHEQPEQEGWALLYEAALAWEASH